MKRLEQLEAGLSVAREHADHELNVSRLLNTHGAAFFIVHEAQPELALVAPVSAVRGQVTYVPSTRCWRCNGSGHISVNCPKGAGPLTFRGKGKGRGKKGRK